MPNQEADKGRTGLVHALIWIFRRLRSSQHSRLGRDMRQACELSSNSPSLDPHPRSTISERSSGRGGWNNQVHKGRDIKYMRNSCLWDGKELRESRWLVASYQATDAVKML